MGLCFLNILSGLPWVQINVCLDRKLLVASSDLNVSGPDIGTLSRRDNCNDLGKFLV